MTARFGVRYRIKVKDIVQDRARVRVRGRVRVRVWARGGARGGVRGGVGVRVTGRVTVTARLLCGDRHCCTVCVSTSAALIHYSASWIPLTRQASPMRAGMSRRTASATMRRLHDYALNECHRVRNAC